MEKINMQLFAEEAEEAAQEVTAESAETEAASQEESKPEAGYTAMQPMLDALANRLGVAPGDGEALAQAIRQHQENQGKEVMETIRQGADRIYDGWTREAEQLKQLYPDFDLRTEMADPRFAGMLRNRIDMHKAYVALHSDEIIPAAMEYAARTVREQMASAMASNWQRPQENGIRSSGAVVLGSDAAHMSRKDYNAICRMVERGERVSFG